MAKIVKDTRQTMDIDTELDRINNEKKKKEKTKEIKKSKKDKKKVVKTKKKLFAGVRSEMAKVKWPSKKDMVKYSVATIFFIVFFGLFFYCIDLLLALLKEVL